MTERPKITERCEDTVGNDGPAIMHILECKINGTKVGRGWVETRWATKSGKAELEAYSRKEINNVIDTGWAVWSERDNKICCLYCGTENKPVGKHKNLTDVLTPCKCRLKKK